jgi:uncharacterized protein YprB with RNaseH-like and TPR domain
MRAKPASPAPAAPPKPAGSQPQKVVYRRDLPRSSPPTPARGPERVVTLQDAIDGTEVLCEGRGAGFLVASPVCDIEDAGEVNARFAEGLAESASAMCRRLCPTCDPEPLRPEDVIFMDIETTGLGNSPLFLIGAMVWESGGFEVKQYLARNYAEEAAVIQLFLDECSPRGLMVTFNGKSFDWPYIRTRAIANGIRVSEPPPHFDMLHECRRIWRGHFEDCKLQTLERHICGRIRHGDIPGAEIPDAYHDYVRTENAWQIVEVLKHNMLDLVTLADLMTRFPPPERRG